MKVQIKLRSAKTCTIGFNYSAHLVALTKSLPGRVWDRNNSVWTIPIGVLEQAVNLYKSKGVEVLVSQDVKIALNELQEQNKAMLQKVQVKALDYDVRSLAYKTTPFTHQFEGIERALQSDNLLLADDMGLGKTLMSITTACIRKDKYGVKKTLIVCGINSVKYNWQQEISIHSYEQGTVFAGKNISERLEMLEAWVNNEDTNYFGIINIESLQKTEILDILTKACKKKIIGMVIIDEIHKCKNPTSIRGKAIHKLNADYKLGLTGTPIMNRVEELYNILKWLGAVNMNFTQFKNYYCNFGGYMNREIIGYKNLEQLRSTLSTCMLRRRKEEVLDLPDKLYKTEYLELDKKSMKLYMGIRQELVKKISEIVLDSNPLSKLLRLRQVTGGLLDENTVKFDRVLEILEEAKANKRKVIIFSQWKAQIDALCSYLEANSIHPFVIDGTVKAEDRQAIVNKYQNIKDFAVIAGTIGAMGTGLTLNTAETVIFLDKAWTPADNKQAEDRAHRIGTKHTVNIVSLVCKDTIDEYIENMLVEKQDLFNNIVEGRDTSKESKEKLIKQLLGVM